MNKIIAFPRQREGSKWFEIKNESSESVDVYLYDFIGDPWIGTDASSIVKQLQGLKSKKINLRINSPGGVIADGLAIYNSLLAHPAEVTTYIDGYAASIASVIALAGKRVVIAENALFMIHNPWVMVAGDAKMLRTEADALDQHKEAIITTYARRTGASRKDLADQMDAETWFTAEEAVKAKFADEIAVGAAAAASAFDLSIYGYANAPKSAAQPNPISASTPETSSPPARLKRRQALLEKLTK